MSVSSLLNKLLDSFFIFCIRFADKECIENNIFMSDKLSYFRNISNEEATDSVRALTNVNLVEWIEKCDQKKKIFLFLLETFHQTACLYHVPKKYDGVLLRLAVSQLFHFLQKRVELLDDFMKFLEDIHSCLK